MKVLHILPYWHNLWRRSWDSGNIWHQINECNDTEWSGDLVEFQQDLASDLNVVLLDVFQRYDNSLVEADIREDLSGTSSNAGHWSTLRWLGRVVEHRVGGVLGVVRLIHAALWSACTASQRRLHTILLSYQYWQLFFTMFSSEYMSTCRLSTNLLTGLPYAAN